MITIKVCERTHSLKVTKSFSAKASIFGSDEYKMLQEARRDYPGYAVKVVSSKSKNSNPYAGLDYDFMKKYIVAHDTAEKTIMAEYLELRAQDEESIEMGIKSATFHEILDWFLETYPEVKKHHEAREAKLETRRQKMAAEKEQRQAAKRKAAWTTLATE